MSVSRMRFSFRWLGMLALSVASGLFPSASRGQDRNESPKELGLSYQDFDQRPGAGWRKIADEGKYLVRSPRLEEVSDQRGPPRRGST
jgi:hypothetical protein